MTAGSICGKVREAREARKTVLPATMAENRAGSIAGSVREACGKRGIKRKKQRKARARPLRRTHAHVANTMPTGGVMARVSKARRFEVLARDGFKCCYCGRAATRAELHVDHFVPIAAGGSDDIDNLRAACADCNSGKSDRVLIANRAGFDLTPDKRPARMAKMRHAAAKAKVDPDAHELWCEEIDEIDEIDCDDQLCSVWCQSHQTYEWHWLPIGCRSGTLNVTKKLKARS
jgi:5-methylcytosine-specific restriction endonuclease McrA